MLVVAFTKWEKRNNMSLYYCKSIEYKLFSENFLKFSLKKVF